MKKLICFIRQEKGGLALLFAIILPFIISCCALAFDGARVITKKARLADALNEAALAIATAGTLTPTTEEIAKLDSLLKHYINAYLPNENIKSSAIDVTYISDTLTGKSLPVYNISAIIDVKTILPIEIAPTFIPKLELTNKGKVRKGLQDMASPTDYVFVVDFSGSMNSSSAQPGMTRIELLKKVVDDITAAALEAYPETTFAIVPFEVGVPVLYEAENEFGGIVNGCSVLMVPIKEKNITLNMETGYDIDYAFWANKSGYLKGLKAPTNSATKLPYTLNDVNKILDTGRYNYYNNYIIPSLKVRDGITYSFDALTKPPFGWCVKNASGSPTYSCEKEPSKSIYSTENQILIEKEMERARRVFLKADSASILNTTAMDIDATLAGMFDSNNIINFPRDYNVYTNSYADPYYSMCLSSGHDARQFYSGKTDRLINVKRNAYLIEPTNDRAVIAEFLNMEANGGTHSSTGLLRAVPEMLKGENPRKVLIVISDGDDNSQYQPVTDKLHKEKNVCERIRQGVKARTNAETDIYFISVVNDKSGQTRTKFWADYCTGEENAFVATNYAELMDKLIQIMSGYEETGYFYN